MNYKQQARTSVILNILLLISYFSIFVSLIAWVWAGWYYGWRCLLSSFILIAGVVVGKIILSITIKNIMNAQQNSQRD